MQPQLPTFVLDHEFVAHTSAKNLSVVVGQLQEIWTAVTGYKNVNHVVLADHTPAKVKNEPRTQKSIEYQAVRNFLISSLNLPATTWQAFISSPAYTDFIGQFTAGKLADIQQTIHLLYFRFLTRQAFARLQVNEQSYLDCTKLFLDNNKREKYPLRATLEQQAREQIQINLQSAYSAIRRVFTQKSQ